MFKMIKLNFEKEKETVNPPTIKAHRVDYVLRKTSIEGNKSFESLRRPSKS